MLLNNNIDHEVKSDANNEGPRKKLSKADQKNLTLKRKRLVRQEAVTQYDDKKVDPPSDVGDDDDEEEKSKILTLQSQSTGSTETVIEAAAVRHRPRPDNLELNSQTQPASGRKCPSLIVNKFFTSVIHIKHFMLLN